LSPKRAGVVLLAAAALLLAGLAWRASNGSSPFAMPASLAEDAGTVPAPAPGPPAAAAEDTAALLRNALAAAAIGDYLQAADLFGALDTWYAATPEGAAAAYQLGVLAYRRDEYAAATKRFADFRTRYPGHAEADVAQFWLAQSQRSSGQTAAALATLDDFARSHPLVEDYVRQQRVQLFSSAKDEAAVLKELAVIDVLPSSPQVKQSTGRLYADALLAAGDYARAAGLYTDLLATAGAGTHLGLLGKQAEALRLAGRTPEAQRALAEIARVYPSSAAATFALTALGGQASQVLTPYQIGRVYYFHAQNEPALAEFQRQVAQLPDGAETPWARYRTALVYERYNRNDAALQELAAVVAAYPAHEAAQDALWERAGLLSALNRFEEAKTAYREFQARFPATQRAQDAVFREALTLYQARDYAGAARSLGAAPTAAAPAAAAGRNQLWRGKALEAAGDGNGARDAYTQAATQAPGAYYGFRAAELARRSGAPATATPAPLRDTAISAADEAEALAWLGRTVAGPVAALADAQARMAAGRYVQRGTLLAAMGLRDAATDEYRNAVRSYKADGPALFVLARLLHDRGEHAPAMLAVAYLQDVTATPVVQNLPRLLLKVLYPAPFQRQVEEAAARHAVDPVLVYALMKQESLFNPSAASGAQAMGLTQVMPATGAEIATALGVPDFTAADLLRPVISIDFGCYYLAKQLAYLGRNPVFALAAYNGGAGSALRWMGNNRQIDPDLFVEAIDYDETRAYVELVMENLAYYTLLYRG